VVKYGESKNSKEKMTMKNFVFQQISQYFNNSVSGDTKGFMIFLCKKNYPKLMHYLSFSVLILIMMLIRSEMVGDYADLIWAHAFMLIFCTAWIIILILLKNKLNRCSTGLFLIPAIVFMIYITYLLGNYAYHSIYFSAYTAVVFIFAIIYTTKWQATALLYISSGFYLHFFTSYGKTGPSIYTASNLTTVGIILTLAWFMSRVIFLIYKNEYEYSQEILKAKNELKSEKILNQQLNERIDDLTVDCNKQINERTQELNRAKIRAEESDRTKALFLANMSHELRTPLSGIIGTLEILSEQDLTLEEKDSLIKMALESSAELKRIIDELMEISRLRSGHFELSEISFNPRQLFLQSENLFKVSASEKGLDFKMDYQHLPERMISDPNRMKQIVDNLLGNAVKFTNEGYIHTLFQTKYDPLSGSSLIITVKDTGIGMDETTQRRLFDYFYQEDNSLRKKYTGIGLGLTLVKHYVQQFEGQINLNSLKHQGTQFQVIIPIKIPEMPKQEEQSKIEKRVVKDSSLTVLIAEDNYINRFILRKILNEPYLKVLEADNGEKAVELFKQNQADLIFMDIQMPIMDGYEAMGKIRECTSEKHVPIIAITGYASTEDKNRIMSLGFDDYLAKPFEKEDILQCVNKTRRGEYHDQQNNQYH